MARVLLDLNHQVFQADWFGLEQENALAVLATLKKISLLDWNELYRDRGLRWEAILSSIGPSGGRIYSLRITRKTRALAYREGDFLRFLSLHPDHDSAYQ